LFYDRPTDDVTITTLYICIGSASLILTLIPIVNFLSRISEVFTPIRTFVITITDVMGASLYSLFYIIYLEYNAPVYLLRIAVGFSGFGAALYIVLISICMFTYCQVKIKDGKWLHKKSEISSEELEVKKCEMYNDYDEDLYKNYVPALHMMATLIIIGANAAVFFYFIT
jgi:hypothetical protein